MTRTIFLATLIVVQSASILPAQATPDTRNKSITQAPSPASRKITVTGLIAPCYKPNRWLVFITSLPRTTPPFESRPTILGADGRFTVVLDATTVRPGDYLLKCGKTKDGAGGMRFTIKPGTGNIDLGVIGSSDV